MAPEVAGWVGVSEAAGFGNTTSISCQELNLDAPLKGTMIFVRRSDDNGNVHLLGRPFLVGDHWRHRLVRCEVNFIHRQILRY